MRCGSINKEAFRSQVDDAPQNDDPVQAETLLYLRTRPTFFTAGDGKRLQDGVHDDHSSTQQNQNRCGIQPDVTDGYIMVAGWRRDANVTLSAADSMGDGRPQRQSCHSMEVCLGQVPLIILHHSVKSFISALFGHSKLGNFYNLFQQFEYNSLH